MWIILQNTRTRFSIAKRIILVPYILWLFLGGVVRRPSSWFAISRTMLSTLSRTSARLAVQQGRRHAVSASVGAFSQKHTLVLIRFVLVCSFHTQLVLPVQQTVVPAVVLVQYVNCFKATPCDILPLAGIPFCAWSSWRSSVVLPAC